MPVAAAILGAGDVGLGRGSAAERLGQGPAGAQEGTGPRRPEAKDHGGAGGEVDALGFA